MTASEPCNLISELDALQTEAGYLCDDDLMALSRRLRVPLSELEAVSSYYPHFRREPAPALRVAVCRDVSCRLQGVEVQAQQLAKLCRNHADVSFERVSCLGRCDDAPACTVNDVPAQTQAAIEHLATPGAPLRSLTESPSQRGWQMDPYASISDRYGVLREELDSDLWGPESGGVVARLEASGLRGMGGAGFPTGAKWRLIRENPEATKYVVCNADESEPGTFKDRVILSELPHLVVEGAILGALAIGAERGWIFIRHEYEAEKQSLERAIAAAYAEGVLGERVCGSSHRFDLEIFTSPGGYILGEETALLEALEGRRGEPRNRPPFPAQEGLWGKPTLVNNVETLAHVPRILRTGSASVRLFSVTGDVARPGVVEVPSSTTVRELIEHCGGMRDGATLAAFMPGGMSAGFLPADRVDVSLDARDPGGIHGAGAVVIVSEGRDLLDLAENVVAFFRNESCGKCVPCRLGTQKALDLLARRDPGDFELIADLGETLRATSLCGLGQVALTPVTSLLTHFRDKSSVRESRSGVERENDA